MLSLFVLSYNYVIILFIQNRGAYPEKMYRVGFRGVSIEFGPIFLQHRVFNSKNFICEGLNPQPP